MGNRAVITINQVGDVKESQELGVYLHWNGGRDSVNAFLKYCELKGYRSPEIDNYGWARLCQVIGNWFGGSLSVGIDKCCNLDCDNGDNGVYLIENWKIVGRQYFEHEDQNEYDLLEFLLDINKKQPIAEQLEEEYIKEKVKNGICIK